MPRVFVARPSSFPRRCCSCIPPPLPPPFGAGGNAVVLHPLRTALRPGKLFPAGRSTIDHRIDIRALLDALMVQ